MSKFSNWSRENLEKFAQEATDKLTIEAQDSRIPMTDEEIRALWAQCAPNPGGTLDFARLIERRCGSAWEAQLVGFIDAEKFRPLLTEGRGVLTMLTRHQAFDEDVPLYALARRNKTLDG